MVPWVYEPGPRRKGQQVGPVLFPAHISESHTRTPLGGEETGLTMAPVPNTHEEGLSPVQHGGAWRGPLSSEAGKEGDPAFLVPSHMPTYAWDSAGGFGFVLGSGCHWLRFSDETAEAQRVSKRA